MDLCVLPQTGTEPWLLVAVIAIVVIGAGIVLAASGKARRRVATGLGAFAIAGALAIGGLGAAPAAQADAGSASCVTAPGASAPAPAADVVVTPGIPALVQQCDVESTVVDPTTTGVKYTQSRDGQVVTVTASAQPGYRILAGATTTWQYDVTAPTAAPSPVALAPERADVVAPAPDEQGSADRFATEGVPLVATLQTAVDAGTEIAYSLDATQAALAATVEFVDAETGAPRPSETVSVPLPNASLTFDLALGHYLFSVPEGTDIEGISEQYNALTLALLGADPTREPISATQFIDGLAIDVAWGQSSVCGEQSTSVDLEAVFFEETLGDGEGPGADVPGFAGQAAPDLLSPDAAADAAEAPVQEPVSDAPAAEAPAIEPTAIEPTAIDSPAGGVEADVLAPVEG